VEAPSLCPSSDPQCAALSYDALILLTAGRRADTTIIELARPSCDTITPLRKMVLGARSVSEGSNFPR
jgi:hypothetical protein